MRPRYHFAVASVNYGEVPADAEEALAGACPIVASYGARDRLMHSHVPRLESALRTLDVPHDVKEYPDAGHSFLNRPNLGPFGPVLKIAGAGYHHPSAEDAWRRILTFFADHLRG